MIERHWIGIAKRERAIEYVGHLQNDTFRQLSSMQGFISAKILKRDVEDGIEFLVITVWQDLDAIQQFAGSNIDIAVVPKIVQDMMLSYDKIGRHYKVDYKIGEIE